MRRGEPGYNPRLDGDNDGIACEPGPHASREVRSAPLPSVPISSLLMPEMRIKQPPSPIFAGSERKAMDVAPAVARPGSVVKRPLLTQRTA